MEFHFKATICFVLLTLALELLLKYRITQHEVEFVSWAIFASLYFASGHKWSIVLYGPFTQTKNRLVCQFQVSFSIWGPLTHLQSST